MPVMSMEQVKLNPFEGWTTIEEAAEIVGRGNSTIRYWVEQGFISSYSIGRKVRVVNIEEVKAYSERNPGHARKSG